VLFLLGPASEPRLMSPALGLKVLGFKFLNIISCIINIIIVVVVVIKSINMKNSIIYVINIIIFITIESVSIKNNIIYVINIIFFLIINIINKIIIKFEKNYYQY